MLYNVKIITNLREEILKIEAFEKEHAISKAFDYLNASSGSLNEVIKKITANRYRRPELY